jgi:hypothetical protein
LFQLLHEGIVHIDAAVRGFFQSSQDSLLVFLDGSARYGG